MLSDISRVFVIRVLYNLPKYVSMPTKLTLKALKSAIRLIQTTPYIIFILFIENPTQFSYQIIPLQAVRVSA